VDQNAQTYFKEELIGISERKVRHPSCVSKVMAAHLSPMQSFPALTDKRIDG